MKCSQCNHRFSCAQFSPGPGGYDAPGCIFPLVVIGAIAGVWMCLSGHSLLALIMVVPLEVLASIALFLCWFDCTGIDTSDKGGQCPQCGHINSIKPWSM